MLWLNDTLATTRVSLLPMIVFRQSHSVRTRGWLKIFFFNAGFRFSCCFYCAEKRIYTILFFCSRSLGCVTKPWPSFSELGRKQNTFGRPLKHLLSYAENPPTSYGLTCRRRFNVFGWCVVSKNRVLSTRTFCETRYFCDRRTVSKTCGKTQPVRPSWTGQRLCVRFVRAHTK